MAKRVIRLEKKMIDVAKIKKLLEEKDITPGQLAESSKLTPHHIKQILKCDIRFPSADTMMKIARALRVGVDEITKE